MKYKLLKDLPGCKAGVVSVWDEKEEGGSYRFDPVGPGIRWWLTQEEIDAAEDWFEKVKEKWYIKTDWSITQDPSGAVEHRFDSEEQAEKYKRWHEPRFSLQDVEDAVLKNSANVTDEIEKLKG
jgi:hypothetical protein